MNRFLSLSETGSAIGMAAATFRGQWRELVETCGFPPPLPHMAGKLLWRPDQVALWLDAWGRADLNKAAQAAHPVIKPILRVVPADPAPPSVFDKQQWLPPAAMPRGGL